jgi:hypothetical protein
MSARRPVTVFEDPPPVWGVGRVMVDGVVTPWPVSEADVDDEARSMVALLTAFGIGTGDLVLIVSLLSEAIHVVPLERAAGLAGALYSSADATPADAFRVASLVRQLEPGTVLGVNTAVLDGLAELGRAPAEVLAPVAVVATSDDRAHAALADAGLAPRRWLKLGPTSGWEMASGRIVYDAARWEVADDAGELVVTSLVPRLTPCRRLRTGLRTGDYPRLGPGN